MFFVFFMVVLSSLLKASCRIALDPSFRQLPRQWRPAERRGNYVHNGSVVYIRAVVYEIVRSLCAYKTLLEKRGSFGLIP